MWLAVQWGLLLTAQPLVPEDWWVPWAFFLHPIDCFMEQAVKPRGTAGKHLWEFPLHPSSSYIVSHHLLAVRLLAKLDASKSYLYTDMCIFCITSVTYVTAAQLLGNIKHLAILLLSKTPSQSPSAAFRKYTLSCHYCTKLVWQLPQVLDKPNWQQMQSEVNEKSNNSLWVLLPIRGMCASPGLDETKMLVCVKIKLMLLVQIISELNGGRYRSILFPH